ncbi:immunity protein Imm33 domain-containing protein [Paraburkholderia bannensis]|uniref:immunity protein Imm33 domain-containing protein n=1 Tax=Paraburkholderia bannensis TaxID=765414 RepID=UPI002AAF6CB2|nr:hypothetical protein [Paraburkholderia bannensis]
MGGAAGAGLTSKIAGSLNDISKGVASATGSDLIGNLPANIAAGLGGAVVGGTAGSAMASNVHLYNQSVDDERALTGDPGKKSPSLFSLAMQGIANGLNAIIVVGGGVPPAASPGLVLVNGSGQVLAAGTTSSASTITGSDNGDGTLSKSPNPEMRDNANTSGTYVDPLFNEVKQADGRLAADHILPQNWIKQQEGFDLLTPAQQSELLNDQMNTQGLPGSFNSSKGAKMPGDWTTYKGQPLDPAYIEASAAQAAALKNDITNRINAMPGNYIMTEMKSHFQGKHGHPDIVVSMPSGPDFGAAPILSFFEDAVRQGRVFRAGETVQMGWMMLTLKETESGDLDVWEPRFGAIPIVWERGASKTYRQLIVQKSVAEQLRLEPSFPSLRQSGVISPDFMASRNFQMFRESSAGPSSGWLFTTEENQSTDGRLASLFEIASKRPEVIPFLALPASSSVVLKDRKVKISYGKLEVTSDSNELLRRLPASDLID